MRIGGRSTRSREPKSENGNGLYYIIIRMYEGYYLVLDETRPSIILLCIIFQCISAMCERLQGRNDRAEL